MHRHTGTHRDTLTQKRKRKQTHTAEKCRPTMFPGKQIDNKDFICIQIRTYIHTSMHTYIIESVNVFGKTHPYIHTYMYT